MRIVIAGGGSVGKFIAEQLHEQGHDVTILDNDPTSSPGPALRRSRPACTWHEGDACEINALTDAGLSDTDVVAAVTGDDEDNLVISLLAKQEFGVPRVVARVNNPKNEWLFNEVWGVDVSVSTPHLLTALVEEAVAVGSFIRLLSFEGGRARLAEVRLADDSPVDGQTIEQLARAPRRDGRGGAAQQPPDRSPRRHDAARRRRGRRAGDRRLRGRGEAAAHRRGDRDRMRLLVVGGTSFVGRHAVEHAVEAGHDVTVFHRGRTNDDLLAGRSTIATAIGRPATTRRSTPTRPGTP